MFGKMETPTEVITAATRQSESGLIMLVDDDQDITDVLKLGLENSGFSVDTYNEPLIALSKFKSKRYDVVILDIRMPRLNGFELYRKMKAIDGNASYCFLTAFDIERTEFDKMFPEIGVKLFIRKPVSISELAARLHRILSRPNGLKTDILT